MKTIFVVLVLFISWEFVYSQNYDPEQQPINNANLTTPIQKHFMLGHHWGASKGLSSSLGATQRDCDNYWFTIEDLVPGKDANHPLMLTTKLPSCWTHCSGGTQVFEAKAIQYSPFLKIDPDDNGKATGNKISPNTEYQTQNPIFGFENINSDIYNGVHITENTQPDPIDHHIRLRINSNTSGSDLTILSKPWVNDQLSRFDADISNANYYKIDTTDNGHKWYISINLRRDINYGSIDDLSILKIEMPYEYEYKDDNGIIHTETDFIIFDQVPTLSYDVIKSPNGYGEDNPRGNYTYLKDAPQGTKYFEISKAMLPTDNALSLKDSSITISASFLVDGLPGHNRRLGNGNDEIQKLNITVTSLTGNDLPTEIDYIRIETPHAKHLFWGEYDDIIINEVTESMKYYQDDNGNDNQFKKKFIIPFRFNNFIEGGMQYWAAERYFNKLIGNLSVGETAHPLPQHYEYYVNLPSRWTGIAKIPSHQISVPFLRKNNHTWYFDDKNNPVIDDLWRSFGIFFGYRGYDPDNSKADLPNTPIWDSYYETWLNSKLHLGDFNQNINAYNLGTGNYFTDQNIGWSDNDHSLQALWENSLYLNYYFTGNNNSLCNTGFQYSEIPWWSQYVACTNVFRDKYQQITEYYDQGKQEYKKSCTTGYTRFLTGEETRLVSWNPIIMGSKGLIFCGGDDMPYDDYHMGNSSTEDFSTDPEAAWRWLNQTQENGRSDFIMRGVDVNGNPREPGGIDTKICTECYNDVAEYFGTTIDRIYIGRRSMRTELKKIYDWINTPSVNETLMNLKLQAWYGKGYAAWYNQNPNINTQIYPVFDGHTASTAVMSKFIDFEHISTKKIFKVYENCTGGTADPNLIDTEPWSESLYDVTLHKLNDKNLADEFYVGIQSRRSDCLMFDEANPGDLYFVPSAELFDNANNTNGGNLWENSNAVPKPQSWWNFHYFHQLGSREITIPFSYVNTSDPEEYCLLRVSELGWDDQNLNDLTKHPWRASTYYDLISPRVVGQDGKVILKLLPGEGKMLKVEVLHPPKINGNLAHSNQSKLVCYPVLDGSGNETGAYRYHLVYFKPLPAPNSDKNGVYYRRSVPITKDCEEANIFWENEINVSDNIYDNKTNPQIPQTYDLHNLVSCDYPSLVVRKENTSVLKAYIVYECSTHASNIISETILEVNGNTVTEYNGNALSTFIGDDHAEWGNPVINASYNMNYYAWSDLNIGIVAGCKTPGSTNLLSKINFHWKTSGSNFLAKHPSMNVYSHFYDSNNEDNCALVWQEPSVNNNPTQIFYTRLRYYNNQLTRYLPPVYQNPTLYHVTCNNNIAFLSDIISNAANTFPVIYRSLEYMSGPSNRLDRVYWESKIISGVSVIAFRPIDLYDNNNNPLNWSVYSISRITRLYYDLLQPNITQGYQLPNTGIYGTGLLLDMKYYTGGMSNLIQLPHDINTLISYNSPTYYFAYNTQEIAEIGNLPHLSKQKCPLNSNQSWLIRRVYNLFNPNPPDIMTSARYSYRQNDEQNINDGLVGFRSINSNYLFYLPKLNNQVVGLKLPFEQFTDSLGITQLIRTNNDTIPSDWFTVEDMSNFEFKCKGNDSSKVRIAIQKESNGHIYNLKLPHHTPDSSGKLCKYILLNGNNCRYRLLFINRNDDAGYSEELWLGGLPVDTMQFTTNKAGVEMNYDVVDLGEGTNQDVINRNMTLSIRPNPADEVVYVRGLLPASAYLEFGNTISNHKIKYQVYSQIGCVQISVEGIPGETVSINTTNLPAGVYFISAEHKSDNYYEPVSPVVEPFVISR